MRDQHFAAAVRDDFYLLAPDLGRELMRHPDFRRRHHTMLDFDEAAAARFVESKLSAAADLKPDARAVAKLGGRGLDQRCGIQVQAERAI